tara:strand:- start:25369 stop:28527 length:3159 start_codon:yes stop_codon:yes gene_type:complete
VVNYFIDRPIFSWVLAIVIMMAGALAVLSLPVSQYPAIAPPAISISGNYPGASAETVENTVTQVIEQQLNGIDNLLYFSSESNKDGSMSITLYFEQGTNPDIAQVQVQNKLQAATPQLPQSVQQQGLKVAKSTKNFLLVVGFASTDSSMNGGDIADYIASHIQDPLSRTPGVGDLRLFGAQHAMRIWLDPARLNSFSMTPVDVAEAIRAQNVQVASGELGGLPAVDGQQLNATIIGPELLKSEEEFRNILLRVDSDGSQVRLKDVARVELGSENYSTLPLYSGQPASGVAVRLASGANALDTAAAVRATVERLEPFFPEGLKAIYPYDSTPFISISIAEVVETLLVAIVLVFLVMLLFLQNLRATLIPTIAVPVVLLGTFGILAVAGYSINTLTMFGMALAIGMLVDDAIVVVENVERVMSEEGLSPKEATRKSMGQITGALIGIALVLTAVLLPMAFFSGSTGVIYRQFSITMVSAMVLSVVVAMIFTPSLCASLLKPVKKGHQETSKGFFGWFNRGFNRFNRYYEKSLQHLTGKLLRYLVVYGLIVITMAFMFTRVPSGFLPEEDQGIMYIQANTPPGATTTRTAEALNKMREYLLEEEKESVEGVFTVAGFSFAGRGQSAGLGFVRLKHWDEREGAEHSAQAVAGRARTYFNSILDAKAVVFVPPAVLELGNATGFDLELVDEAGRGHAILMEARDKLISLAAQHPVIQAPRANGLDDEPQYTLDIDWEKAHVLGLTAAQISDTIHDAWGSSYINQFIDHGRVKKVYVQGEPSSRMSPEDLDQWFVRNNEGGMVPFSSFASAHWTSGSPKLERYNGKSAVQILGKPAPGFSTGEAMEAMEDLAQQMPDGIGYQWSGLSYEQQRSGSQAPALYAISLAVVFLCLAALYESWSIPFSVMLVVPLGVIGAIAATLMRGLENDVFFQVGLLTTVGLSIKNAILIVEFAKQNVDAGMGLIEGTIAASCQRLRPILMTSMAFILGVSPLAFSSGAGSGGRIAIGTGVMGGMIVGVILAIFLVPVFFVAVRRWLARGGAERQRNQEALQPAFGEKG